jgi:hypothetical protein
VLSVDFAALAYAATAEHSVEVPRAAPAARVAVLMGVFTVVATAVATLSRAPGCLPPGVLKEGTLCAGTLVVAVLSAYAVAAMAMSWCCFGRRAWLAGLYIGWAAGETVLGVGAGFGLQFVSAWLFVDTEGHAIAHQWTWFWHLVQVNHLLSWASVGLQIVIFWLLLRTRAVRAHLPPRRSTPVPQLTNISIMGWGLDGRPELASGTPFVECCRGSGSEVPANRTGARAKPS